MVGRRRDARDEIGPVGSRLTCLPWPLPDQQRIGVEVPGSAASPWPGAREVGASKAAGSAAMSPRRGLARAEAVLSSSSNSHHSANRACLNGRTSLVAVEGPRHADYDSSIPVAPPWCARGGHGKNTGNRGGARPCLSEKASGEQEGSVQDECRSILEKRRESHEGGVVPRRWKRAAISDADTMLT
jgi:hypothetical protein